MLKVSTINCQLNSIGGIKKVASLAIYLTKASGSEVKFNILNCSEYSFGPWQFYSFIFFCKIFNIPWYIEAFNQYLCSFDQASCHIWNTRITPKKYYFHDEFQIEVVWFCWFEYFRELYRHFYKDKLNIWSICSWTLMIHTNAPETGVCGLELIEADWMFCVTAELNLGNND